MPQPDPKLRPYVFFRKEGFYVVDLPGDESIPENVRLNPGTLRVEDIAGNVLFQLEEETKH